MPNLVSMKLTPKQKKEMTEPFPLDEEKFPFGLRIDLQDEQVSKLGLEGVAAGTEVKVMALANVKGVRVNDTDRKGKNISVELQITGMAVDTGKSDKEKADVLFSS